MRFCRPDKGGFIGREAILGKYGESAERCPPQENPPATSR